MLEPLTIGLVAAALGGDGRGRGVAEDVSDDDPEAAPDAGETLDAEAFRGAGGYPEPVSALATGFWAELQGELRAIARRGDGATTDRGSADRAGPEGDDSGDGSDPGSGPGDDGGSTRDSGPGDDDGSDREPGPGDEEGSDRGGFDPAAAVAALSSVDAGFRDEVDAVVRIVDALSGTPGLDAEEAEPRRALVAAVVGACRATVADADALGGTALADELGLAEGAELDRAIRAATRRFDRLAAGASRSGHVAVVEPGADADGLLRAHVADPETPFVDRPELDRRVVPRAPATGQASSVGCGSDAPTTGSEVGTTGSGAGTGSEVVTTGSEATTGSGATGPRPVRTVLVVGGTGAGKSRTLVELHDRIAGDRPVVAVFPGGTVRHPADVEGIEAGVEAAVARTDRDGPDGRGGPGGGQAGDGEGPADDGAGGGPPAEPPVEVVVVRDDADAVAPRTGNAAVRALGECARELAAAGYPVRLLLSADADGVRDLPGSREDPSDPLWAGAETVELDGLGADRLASLFEAALDRHGLDADDGTVAALAEHAAGADPTPFYVESVVEVAAGTGPVTLPGVDPPGEGGADPGDVPDVPPDALALWEEAYDRLGAAGPGGEDGAGSGGEDGVGPAADDGEGSGGEEGVGPGGDDGVGSGGDDGTAAEDGDGDAPSAPQRALKALALLSATGAPSPPPSRLVAGVYEHVFGGHPGAFDPAIRTLDARGWIEVLGPGPGGPGFAPVEGGHGAGSVDPGRDPIDPDRGQRGTEGDLGDPAEAVAGGEWPLDGPVGLGVAYRVHGGKLDAVPLSVERHLDALSALYAGHLDRYLEPADPRLAALLPPPDPRVERALQDGLATALLARGDERPAERHFERLVAGIVPDGDLPRFEYTLALSALGDSGSGNGPSTAEPGADPGDAADRDPTSGQDPGPGQNTSPGQNPAPGQDPTAGQDPGDDAARPAGGIAPRGEDLDPELARAHREYAALLSAAGDRTAAATHYERALGIDPESVPAHRGYADLLAGEDDDRARAHYERALALAPEDADLHREYADLQADADRASALAHYERAIDLDPDDAEAHFGCATLLFRGGDADDAVEHYERAIEADPDHARARYNYALVCRERGDHGAAAEHLERAVDAWVRRDRPDAAVEDLATLVEVLLDRGQPGAAREACERGRELIDRAGLSPNAYAVRWIESEALRLDLLAAAEGGGDGDPTDDGDPVAGDADGDPVEGDADGDPVGGDGDPAGADADGDPVDADTAAGPGPGAASDLSKLYETALLHGIAGDDRRSLFLLATVWDRRSLVDPDSPAGADAAAAGTALAGHLRAMDRPGVRRPEGMLARIRVGTDVDPDPAVILAAVEPHAEGLPDPARPVYEFLAREVDGPAGEGECGGAESEGESGGTESEGEGESGGTEGEGEARGEGPETTPEELHAMAAGSLPEDLGRDTLEPHVFATLLESLIDEGDPF